MLAFRALCVELQRPPFVCLTIFFEGIKLLSTYTGWLNAETLEIPFFGKVLLTHGHSFMRLWYIYVHVWYNSKACFPDLSLQMYE